VTKRSTEAEPELKRRVRGFIRGLETVIYGLPFTKDGDFLRVATEPMNVLLDPLQRKSLVEETHVPFRGRDFRRTGESEHWNISATRVQMQGLLTVGTVVYPSENRKKHFDGALRDELDSSLYIDVPGFSILSSAMSRISRRWQTLSSESVKEGKIHYTLRKAAGVTGPKTRRKIRS
jgi:hypothetical protein